MDLVKLQLSIQEFTIVKSELKYEFQNLEKQQSSQLEETTLSGEEEIKKDQNEKSVSDLSLGESAKKSSQASVEFLSTTKEKKTPNETIKRRFTLGNLLLGFTKSEKDTKAETNESYGSIQVKFKSKKGLKTDIWSGIDTGTECSDNQSEQSSTRLSSKPLITINEEAERFDQTLAERQSNNLIYENNPDIDSLHRRVTNLNINDMSDLKSMSLGNDREKSKSLAQQDVNFRGDFKKKLSFSGETAPYAQELLKKKMEGDYNAGEEIPEDELENLTLSHQQSKILMVESESSYSFTSSEPDSLSFRSFNSLESSQHSGISTKSIDIIEFEKIKNRQDLKLAKEQHRISRSQSFNLSISSSQDPKNSDSITKLDEKMATIIQQSLKKSKTDNLNLCSQPEKIKKIPIYPKLMEIRYEYFTKLKHMLKKNRRLGFENIYESETPISEMQLSTLKHGILEDISAKYHKITCVQTDPEMRMVAIGTSDGELVISSTKNSNFYREEISREKGGKGKTMRKLPSGETDFITAMYFWADPYDIYEYNESFGQQEKTIYKFYHKGMDLEEDEESQSKGNKNKLEGQDKKGKNPDIIPAYKNGYDFRGILLLGFKSGRIESLRFDSTTFKFVRYCIIKKPSGNKTAITNLEEILSLAAVGDNCQNIVFIDATFKVQVAEFSEFYERGNFKSHRYTRNKSKGLGAMLLGKLNLSLTNHFDWRVLEELENNCIPHIRLKTIYIDEYTIKIMLVPNGNNIHFFRVDEPDEYTSMTVFTKLGVICAPMNVGRIGEECFVDFVFDEVGTKKLSHIVIAWANYIACYRVMSQLILPENFHKDYKMFIFHSMIEVTNVIISLTYFQNGLCCYMDEKGQFGIYNVRKHTLMEPKEKIITSHTNLVQLQMLNQTISSGNQPSQEFPGSELFKKHKNMAYQDRMEDNGLNRVSQLMTHEFDLDEPIYSETGVSDNFSESVGEETKFEIEGRVKQHKFKKTVRYDQQEVNEISAIINSRLSKKHLLSVPINNHRSTTYSKTICSGKNSQILIMTQKGLKIFEMLHWVVYAQKVIEKGTTRQVLCLLNDLLDQRSIKLVTDSAVLHQKIEYRLRNKGLLKGLSGLNLRDVPSFSHFLDKEEKFKHNFLKLGVFYTENKFKILMEPLVAMRAMVKQFISSILVERLLNCQNKEIDQTIKQSIFLLTKLRMRYFILDDYWRVIQKLERQINQEKYSESKNERKKKIKIIESSYLDNLRLFYECGMIKLLDENFKIEDKEMQNLCEEVFDFSGIHDTYSSIRSTSLNINTLKVEEKVILAPEPEEIKLQEDGQVESYLKTKLELEELQRERFDGITGDLFQNKKPQLALQFLLYLFKNEIYNSIILKHLISEQECYLLSYIILNWKKKNNVKLDSIYGRNCIRVIPLVMLIKKIEYFKEQETERQLEAINEEDEFSDENSEEERNEYSRDTSGLLTKSELGNTLQKSIVPSQTNKKSNFKCSEKDKLIYELYWYIFEVLIGHFGEGQYNKKHIQGDKDSMVAVLRFLFDEQWIKTLLKFNQTIFLSMIKFLIKSGIKIVIDQFTYSINRFLEKQRKMKMKDGDPQNQNQGISFSPPLFEEEEYQDSEDEEVTLVTKAPEKAGFLKLRKLWKKLKRKKKRKRKASILENFKRRSFTEDKAQNQPVTPIPAFSPGKAFEKKQKASLNTFLVLVHECLLDENQSQDPIRMAPFYLLISQMTLDLNISVYFQKKILKLFLEKFELITQKYTPENQLVATIIKLFRIYRMSHDVKLYDHSDFELKSLVENHSNKKLYIIILELYSDPIQPKQIFLAYQRLISEDKLFRKIMFEWMKNEISMEGERHQKLIEEVMETEHSYLINQDHEEFAILLSTLDILQRVNFILKYKLRTRAKLKIVEKILKYVKSKHMENEISHDFFMEYMALLNMYKPKKALEELKQNKYPLTECLTLCEENKNQLAIAYVKGRLGFYDDALRIYCGRMRKVLRALVKGNRINHDKKKKKLFNIFKGDFNCALSLCLEAEDKEKLLMSLLKSMIDSQVKYNKIPVKKFSSKIKKVLDIVLECAKGEQINQLLSEHMNCYKLKDIVILAILDSFHHNNLILNSSLLESIAKTYDSTLVNMKKAFRGSYAFDPKLGIALNPQTKIQNPEFQYEIQGDSRMVFGCNHMVPVYKYDVDVLEQKQKKIVFYCARCETKNVETRVIRRLERRSSKISNANENDYGLPLEFIDSSRLLKGHPQENIDFFHKQRENTQKQLKNQRKKATKKLKKLTTQMSNGYQISYKFNNRTDTLEKDQKAKTHSKIKLMKKFDKFSTNYLNSTMHLEKDLILSQRERRLKEKRDEQIRIEKERLKRRAKIAQRKANYEKQESLRNKKKSRKAKKSKKDQSRSRDKPKKCNFHQLILKQSLQQVKRCQDYYQNIQNMGQT